MRQKIITLSLLGMLLLTGGFGCQGVSQQVQEKMQPITLNYWRVWDGPDDFKEMIAEYNKVHPNISIKYRKLSYEEYEQELLNALAEDRGPDIFSVNAAWLPKYQSKIAFMPDSITMAYPVVKGQLKKEVVPELRTQKSISLTNVKDGFLDTVYNDVTLNYYDPQTGSQIRKVYGLPLAIDTLATFYNKDLLNNAGIAQLPDYWNKQFQTDVKKLTKQNSRGEIIQSGVALGGGFNIERAGDILAALMMQNGATIIDEQGRVTFRQYSREKNYNPGIDAIRFYTDFANPTKDVYSWNKTLPNSLQMFIQGKLAIMFGYSYHLPLIRAAALKLNFGVKQFPQIEGRDDPKNVVDYWVETVSKKSKHPAESWDFVQFITAQPAIAKLYLDRTKRPTAIKSLLKEQSNDSELSVFAKQLLTARSWYHGSNYKQADKAFKELVEAISDNPENWEHETSIAEGKIMQTLK